MIKSNKSLSMAEATEYAKKNQETGKELVKFIKKFTKLKVQKAKELRKKLRELELLKINDKHISKLIDFLPDTQDELNKAITNIDLNEDEREKILNTIKEFK